MQLELNNVKNRLKEAEEKIQKQQNEIDINNINLQFVEINQFYNEIKSYNENLNNRVEALDIVTSSMRNQTLDNLYQIINKQTNLTQLKYMIDNQSLKTIIENSKFLTIIAPIDNDFIPLIDPKDPKYLNLAEDEAKDIILSHIVPYSSSILDQFVYFMKPGDSFTFSTLGSYNLNIKIEDDGSVSVSSPGTKSAKLLNKEIVSKNGILQFVDKVLLP